MNPKSNGRPADSWLMPMLILAGVLAGALVSEAWLVNWLLGETRWLAMATGAALGALWARTIHQGRRIEALERQFSPPEPSPPEPSPPEQSPPTETSSPTGRPGPKSADTTESPTPARPMQAAAPASRQGAKPETDRSDEAGRPKSHPEGAGTGARLLDWLLGGNLPVRIGVVVSLIGLAAALRYATDQGWIVLPTAVRLALVGLVGIAAVVFGWRQRLPRPAFGLALQGGGIGVLLLTLFAAFRLYALLPGTAAFALMIVLVAGAGLLALAQSSRSLAALALLAGFGAPLLLAEAGGDPVALFSWYAVLNLAVAALALTRDWPVVNRLGLIATFGIAGYWGVLEYRPEHYAMAQPFLLLYFAIYLIIPLLTARRGRSLDVPLVFALPLLALPLQAGLFEGERMAIALSALLGALVYLGSAAIALRALAAPTLGRAHAVLALGLATLAVPFAFSGYTVALIWALEGAALVWFGCARDQRLTRLAGLALQLLAAGAWFSVVEFSWRPPSRLLLNPVGLGGLALAFAGIFSAWRFDLARARGWLINLLALWGIGFWTLAGLLEIQSQVRPGMRLDALVILAGLTAVAAAWIHSRRGWAVAGVTPALALIAALPLALIQQVEQGWPLDGWSGAVWVGVFGLVWLVDRLMARSAWRLGPVLAGHTTTVVVLALSGAYLTASVWELGRGWQWLAAGLPLLALTGWLCAGLRPPLCAAYLPRERIRLVNTFALAALIPALGASLFSAGETSPLPWLPLVNPLELAQLAALVLLTACALDRAASIRLSSLFVALVALTVFSTMTLRGVHHLGEVPWRLDSLLASHTTQASLSIVWTVIGVIAVVIASRRSHRPAWWAGALLMGIVLVKLALVDRQFLSTLAGIASFMGFGVLSILVGYLAPVPPAGDTRQTERS